MIIHRILNEAFGDREESGDSSEAALEARRSWLEWSILSQEWFPKLHQPPYGDRAISLKASNRLIGSIGYVPLLMPFEQIPELTALFQPGGYYTPEVGLFWAIEPKYQRQGYATEAAQRMVDYAFGQMWAKRILATTEYANLASQKVMGKIGMTVVRNPSSEPTWLQVVGILKNATS